MGYTSAYSSSLNPANDSTESVQNRRSMHSSLILTRLEQTTGSLVPASQLCKRPPSLPSNATLIPPPLKDCATISPWRRCIRVHRAASRLHEKCGNSGCVKMCLTKALQPLGFLSRIVHYHSALPSPPLVFPFSPQGSGYPRDRFFFSGFVAIAVG